MSKINVTSEINTLKKVIIHTPGHELEQMTPDAAKEVLYDDILNLENARKQHGQLKAVLKKISQPLEVKDLLKDILKKPEVQKDLVKTICTNLDVVENIKDLMDLEPDNLADQLITGTLIKRDNLTRFLSKNSYSIAPLPNLFFTRDAAMVISNKAVISNMATDVRYPESIIMRCLFQYHPELNAGSNLLDFSSATDSTATFEGGDVLILREDTLAIGMSSRTSSSGIDQLIDFFKKEKMIKNIFVVMLPKQRAMLHLDMLFTMIDYDKAIIFPDLINERNAVDIVQIDISDPDKPKFSIHDYLLKALETVNIKLEPIYCGGHDPLYQKREQWQSGANFLTLAPGKIIGFGMNHYTFEELSKAGIPRVEAMDVMKNKVDLNKLDKYAIAMQGGELSRGGGGCRCMTMPVLRD